jgi:serine-type D-Ala-D-Ala carboxypeptidase
MPGFPRAQSVMRRFVDARTAPCAVAEVGDASGARWRAAEGRLRYEAGAPAASPDTIFDLASLTKVLATAASALRAWEGGGLDLGAPVGELVPAWRGADRERATVLDLLAHASGLPGHRPYYQSHAGRAAFERAICSEPLAYAPGTASVYSDLGFILLGFILEEAARRPLDGLFAPLAAEAGASGSIAFGLPDAWLQRLAPASDVQVRKARVDDDNAAALGGVAGHAGLFGSVDGVGRLARGWLSAWQGRPTAAAPGSPAAVRRFTSRAGTPGSSRALGWDTMLPTSSCGTRMSADAFGHTGFTGTSLWIDPNAGVYAVLLANRVYPSPGPVDAIAAFRRAFHDAVMDDLEG